MIRRNFLSALLTPFLAPLVKWMPKERKSIAEHYTPLPTEPNDDDATIEVVDVWINGREGLHHVWCGPEGELYSADFYEGVKQLPFHVLDFTPESTA
jgi:hypothetical protein